MRNIIFDLDGTLVHSLPGIEESACVAIARALPEMPMPDLRPFIGPPVAQMFAKIWPELPAESMARLLVEFRKHYDDTGCLHSEPYPQVPEVLARLHQAGLRLFVLTNKPVTPAKKILAHLGLADFFTEIMGPDSVNPPFQRKPDGARLLAQKFGLAPDSTALVGDGVDDAQAAAACGFHFIAAAYGYGKAAEGNQPAPLMAVKNICEIEGILL
jgi:phosphoglycolate phosphatase